MSRRQSDRWHSADPADTQQRLLNVLWRSIMPMLFAFIDDPVHITGHVTGVGGAPLSARIERVEFEAGFEDNESRFADATHGRFHEWLPDGTWTLRFSADGYASEARSVQVAAGQTVTLEVALLPAAAK